MKRFALVALGLLLTVSVGSTQTFFSDDFNTGGTDGAISRGWQFTLNDYVTESIVDFGVADPDAQSWPSGKASGTSTGFYRPPTADGTESDGAFLISDSDAADGSDNIGSLAEVFAITPKFSTAGSSGTVWFHADVEIDFNNNGEALVFVDVSVDGGTTWTHAWIGVEPQRVEKAASVPTDVEGNPTGSAVTNGWPSVGPDANNPATFKTWDGIHGRWHLALPSIVENKAEVMVRMGWFESADAWYFAVDNLVIDNVPPPTGNETILTEDFASGIPATWGNQNLTTISTLPENEFFELGAIKWDTQAIRDPLNPTDPFKLINGVPVDIDITKYATFMGLTLPLDFDVPDPEVNPNGTTDGRFIMALAGQGYALYQEPPYGRVGGTVDESAALDTPALDLSNATGVYIDFDSEVLIGRGGNFYQVQYSKDGGAFQTIFDYTKALMDYEEAPYFMHHYLEVPDAAGSSNVVFRFLASASDPTDDVAPDYPSGNGHMAGFWVIDNVSVTIDSGTPVSSWDLF